MPTVHPDPLRCDDFAVTVNGRSIDVHGAKSCRAPWPFRFCKAGTHPGIRLARPDAWGGPVQLAPGGNAPYAFTGFDLEGPATVTVAARGLLNPDAVRPVGAARVKSLDPHTLELILDRPMKLSIEPAGRHGGLLLFADPPLGPSPDPTDPRVRYFGPGLHRPGLIELHSDEVLHLARGAVVEGGIRVANARNVRIEGRGILCGDPWGWRDGPQPHMMMFEDCQNIHIQGITVRCSWQWTLRLMACRDATIRNLKICGGKNLNDDGIDPCSTRDVAIEDCFIRTQDDCISVKAHCDDRRPCERILIRDCLLWSDLSRVLMVGPESHADRIGDIQMRDCQVLRLGPRLNEAGVADWNGCASAFCFEAGEDCRMEDITVENVKIHVEANRDGKDVVLVQPMINAFMKRQTAGHLRGIRFRNVAFIGEKCRPRIRLQGKDEAHTVEDIAFENVTLFGEPLTADHPALAVGQHTKDIRFS